jgi:hypothetical protein
MKVFLFFSDTCINHSHSDYIDSPLSQIGRWQMCLEMLVKKKSEKYDQHPNPTLTIFVSPLLYPTLTLSCGQERVTRVQDST